MIGFVEPHAASAEPKGNYRACELRFAPRLGLVAIS